MTSAQRKPETERLSPRGADMRDIDSGEIRSVMLAAAALGVFLYLIRWILLPFILPAIIAYICTPGLDWLAEKTRWPRLLFAVLAFALIIGTAAAAGYFGAGTLLDELRGLSVDLQSTLEQLAAQAIGDRPVHLLGYTLTAQQIVQAALAHIRDWLEHSSNIGLLLGYGLASIMSMFLFVVLTFYFLASGKKLASSLLWLAPPHRRPLVRSIWKRLDPVLTRYFVGMILVMIYATAASYVGLGFFLGIHHAVLLALLTGALETVPVLGPTSAAVVAGLISLRTATGLMSIIDYALYATALRLSIDQLFGPIVLGRAAHVHPVLIIFCFFAGGIIFGIPGVILAVPVALLVKITLATLYGDPGE